MKYVFLFVCLFFSKSSLAKIIEGHIYHQQSSVQIKLLDSLATFNVFANNNTLGFTLSQLQSGDFISAEGNINIIDQKATLSRIKYVGLNKLMGRWISEHGEIFDFLDYQSVNYYPPRENNSRLKKLSQGSTTISYRVTSPSSYNVWNLMFASDKSTGIGSLMIFNKFIILTTPRPDGSPDRVINLRPVIR